MESSDVLADLEEWIERQTKMPAGPSAPAAYQRVFLARVAEEIRGLRDALAAERERAKCLAEYGERIGRGFEQAAMKWVASGKR
jgi:hypothetical protein